MSWLVGFTLVAALLLGVWIGRPRRFDQPLEELDERIAEPGEHQKVTRRKTILNSIHFLQRKKETGSSRRRAKAGRTPFRLR